MRRNRSSASQSPAYSFLEVLVSLVILLMGILAILAYFPSALRANDRAVILSEAALLAQRKAEEIRRDDDASRSLIQAIRILRGPTVPVVFPENNALAYRFSGVSVLEPGKDDGVARVIVQYAEGFRPDGRILYELKFGE